MQDQHQEEADPAPNSSKKPAGGTGKTGKQEQTVGLYPVDGRGQRLPFSEPRGLTTTTTARRRRAQWRRVLRHLVNPITEPSQAFRE